MIYISFMRSSFPIKCEKLIFFSFWQCQVFCCCNLFSPTCIWFQSIKIKECLDVENFPANWPYFPNNYAATKTIHTLITIKSLSPMHWEDTLLCIFFSFSFHFLINTLLVVLTVNFETIGNLIPDYIWNSWGRTHRKGSGKPNKLHASPICDIEGRFEPY